MFFLLTYIKGWLPPCNLRAWCLWLILNKKAPMSWDTKSWVDCWSVWSCSLSQVSVDSYLSNTLFLRVNIVWFSIGLQSMYCSYCLSTLKIGLPCASRFFTANSNKIMKGSQSDQHQSTALDNSTLSMQFTLCTKNQNIWRNELVGSFRKFEITKKLVKL
jgi:hypothetical protein